MPRTSASLSLCSVLNFQAKFGSVCSTASKLAFSLGRWMPRFSSGFKLDVSKLSIRAKPVHIPNRATHLIQCRVGYVSMKKSDETLSDTVHPKENTQEAYNEKLLNKMADLGEEIHKTQLRFTQELHQLTINLPKMIDK